MTTSDVDKSKMSLTAANNIMGFVKDFFTDALKEGYSQSKAMKLWEDQVGSIQGIIDDSMVVTKKEKKKDSSPKDPNKPKKGRSAYIFYAKDIRPSVKKELGEDVKAIDVTKEIAARWRKIKDSPKKADKATVAKYTKIADKDKERASKEMETYEPPTDEEILAAKPKRGRKSTKKKSDKPTKGRTAYIFYCAEHRQTTKEQNLYLQPKEITKLLSEMWKEVKEKEGGEFRHYKKKSDEDKKRYEKEMETYEPSDDDEDHEEKPPLKKAKKDIVKKVIAIKQATPKKIETVGFKKFSNANREGVKEENPGLNTAQITKLLKEEWNEFDNEEKKEWFEEDQE
jgi:hypothetical protein